MKSTVALLNSRNLSWAGRSFLASSLARTRSGENGRGCSGHCCGRFCLPSSSCSSSRACLWAAFIATWKARAYALWNSARHFTLEREAQRPRLGTARVSPAGHRRLFCKIQTGNARTVGCQGSRENLLGSQVTGASRLAAVNQGSTFPAVQAPAPGNACQFLSLPSALTESSGTRASKACQVPANRHVAFLRQDPGPLCGWREGSAAWKALFPTGLFPLCPHFPSPSPRPGKQHSQGWGIKIAPLGKEVWSSPAMSFCFWGFPASTRQGNNSRDLKPFLSNFPENVKVPQCRLWDVLAPLPTGILAAL